MRAYALGLVGVMVAAVALSACGSGAPLEATAAMHVAATTAAASASRVDTRPAPFADSFESGGFAAGGWYWGQSEADYGHVAVVDPAREGIPQFDGARAARFATTPDDIAHGRIHAKIYKELGSDVGAPTARPPLSVSGTYSAWYYLPASYRVPAGRWVNIFQFKEKYHAKPGDPGTSDPSWWLQLSNCAWARSQARSLGASPPRCQRYDQPVVFVNHWDSHGEQPRFRALPLGRWFAVEASVRQRDRIAFYVAGALLDVAHQRDYPVGPFHGEGSMEWIWGLGNYSDGVDGPLYIDKTSYSPG